MEDMVAFINTHAGTEREASGELKSTAGRVVELDELIAVAKYEISPALVSTLSAAVSDLTGEPLKKGQAYLSAVEKAVAKGGATYVEKEVQRLAGLIAKGNITPETKAGFQLRQNILKAFLSV